MTGAVQMTMTSSLDAKAMGRKYLLRLFLFEERRNAGHLTR
jgi:hypothetical protein